MTVGYATGESVLVKLSGCAEDANIVLEKTSVKLPSTHITRVSHESVRIRNLSDVKVYFRWVGYSSIEEGTVMVVVIMSY